MEHGRSAVLTIEAELDTPSVAVELQRLELPDPIETAWLPASDQYRIDFGLTSRTPDARISFPGRWPAHRFEVPGAVYVVPPGEPLRARSDAGTQEAVVCLLGQETLDDWLDGHAGGIGRDLEAGLDIRRPAILRLMTRLGEEVRAPGFASAAMCEALAMQLAVELGRHYDDRERSPARTGLAPWRLALVEDRIRAAHAPPSLSELALLCGLSPRHLARGFRSSRGCSIGEFIAGRQIERARTRLADGEPIKAVAHELGFASRSGFSHAFRRATGLAPQQYRRTAAATRARRPG